MIQRMQNTSRSALLTAVRDCIDLGRIRSAAQVLARNKVIDYKILHVIRSCDVVTLDIFESLINSAA
jgi:hypothetical protein